MEKRIKIMNVAEAYPGGVPVYIETLVKALDKSRFESILVCSQAYEESRFSPFFDIVKKIEISRSFNLIKIFPSIFAIRKLVKKYRPDIIYCHSSFAGVVGRMAAIGCGSKVLYNAHSWSFNMRMSYKKKLIYRVIEKVLAHVTDKIVCVSDFEKKVAMKYGVAPSDKLEVIYNGIDVKSLREKIEKSKLTRDALGIPSDAYVVGTVCRISEQKAPDVFVEAAKKIKKSIPNAFFLMVGDGPDQDSIQEQICSNGLKDSFFITGWVNNPYDYMTLFDQALLLSRWEAFGLVLVEYMVAKKAVVCTNADAMPEIIKNDENGIVVNVDDYEAVARAVIRLHDDTTLKEKLTDKAFEVAQEKFDSCIMVHETSKLFENMAKKTL